MLPASEIEIPARAHRAAFRPSVLDGARPLPVVEQLTAVMEALQYFVEASLLAFDGADPSPPVPDEALDVRLASL